MTNTAIVVPETSELIEIEKAANQIVTLNDAWALILVGAKGFNDHKNLIIRTIMAIKTKKLYTEAVDDQGENFTKFSKFLVYSKELLKYSTNYSLESVRQLIKCFVIWEQLGYTFEETDNFGSHKNKILPAARINNDLIIEEDDVVQPNGTRKLGFANFLQATQVVNQMLGNVQLHEETLDIIAEIPEIDASRFVIGKNNKIVTGQWGIEDTIAYVAWLRGQAVVEKFVIVDVESIDDKTVFVKNIRVMSNTIVIEHDESVMVEDLKLMKKQFGLVVNGLEDEMDGD